MNASGSIQLMTIIVILAAAIIAPIYAASSIEIKTDKDTIVAGDKVSVSGTLDGVSESTPIAIEIKDAASQTILVRTIQTDDKGNFALQFKVPDSTKSGNLTIFVNAKIGGQTVSSTRVVSVIKEQTPPGPSPAPTPAVDLSIPAWVWGALIGGIVFAIYAIKKRKNKKKASRDRIDFTAPSG